MNTNWKIPALALAAFLSLSATAQQGGKKSPEADKKKTQTITIVRSGESDEKITVEVDGDKVTVNGKPLDAYKGDIEVVTGSSDVYRVRPGRLKSLDVPTPPMVIAGPGSDRVFSWNSNAAVLGVSTENGEGGAKVTEVSEGSAAEKAGLKSGDVITKVNDLNVADADDLPAAIAKFKPEEKITITYKRDGKEQTASATLQKNDHSFSRAFAMTDDFDFHFDTGVGHGKAFGMSHKPRLGLQVEELEEGKGVKVLSVNAETPAGKAGILKDDVISSFNGKEINSVDDLRSAMKEVKEGETIKVVLQRAGTTQTVDVKFPKAVKKASL